MKTDELIKAVKVKLDEISPFEEPTAFDDNDDDAFRVVKPIVSTIADCLPKAAWFCLNNLPISLLGPDVDYDDLSVSIDRNGVGHVDGMEKYSRFIRMRSPEWKRDATVAITTSDPLYLIQQDSNVRAGACKPMVVYSAETGELELYSFPHRCCCGRASATLWYIDCHKSVEKVKSPIEDFIVLSCAAYVAEIMGNVDAAKMFQTEYNNKQQTVLN